MKPNKLDTPRDGKAWCDVVNTQPMTKLTRPVLAIGTCNADGSGYKPYPNAIERQVPTGSYLWL
ncbi:MAG: hypothetical protein NVS3B3_04460 [Aquirhabdus sp.]